MRVGGERKIHGGGEVPIILLLQRRTLGFVYNIRAIISLIRQRLRLLISAPLALKYDDHIQAKHSRVNSPHMIEYELEPVKSRESKSREN